MLFYKDISIYYEKIFPLNTAAVEFLEEELDGKKKILDLACGDGKYSDSLLTPDRSVTGVDLDKGMLEEAEKKYDKKNNIKFVYGDMMELSSIFKKDKFDEITAIPLDQDNHIADAMRYALEPYIGGKFSYDNV